MEDDEIDTSSGGSLLAVALAGLAILLGGAGLYFGMTANQRLSPLADSMEAGSGASARLEKSITALETQLAELSAQNTELQSALSRLRVYGTQTEQTVKQLTVGVQENRAELVKLAGRLNELLQSRAPTEPAPTEPAATESATARQALPAAAPEASPGRAATADTYAIVAGDNFVRIASKLGVDLQALLDANPGVDHRRLRIGQEINIPPAP